MEYETMMSRFACKSCNGVGRFDDHICNACRGEGFSVTAQQRQYWHTLMRAVNGRTERFRLMLLKEADKTFRKCFPMENTECLMHPEVRKALSAQSVKHGSKSKASVLSVLFGRFNWRRRAISLKDTGITVSVQKKQAQN